MGGWLYRVGRFAVRRRRTVVGIWFAGALLCLASAQLWGGDAADSFSVPGTESQRAIDLLFDKFPEQAGARAQLVFHVPIGSLSEPDRAGAIEAALDNVARVDHVVDRPSLVPASLVKPGSPDAERTAIAQVLFDVPVAELGKSSSAALDKAMAPADAFGIQTEVGGDLQFALTQPETSVAEGAGVVVAAVILLFAFGSVVGMGLPVGIALFGLGTGTALVSFLALVIKVATSAPILASMIGIGVGIDYALFIVSRHRQHLTAGMTVEEAAGRANATAGQAVVFAGGTVVIAICGLVLVGIPFMTSMGFAAAIVVAVMVVASVTLLPALMGFAGEKLAIPTLRSVREREQRHAERVERLVRLGADAPRTGWERLADEVSSRPWRYLLGGTAVLLVLALPTLSMRLGQNDGGTAAKSTALRRSYDLVAEAFGPGFNGPLLVTMEVPPGDEGTADALVTAMRADPGVALVAPPQRNASGDTAIVIAIPRTKPDDVRTTQLVHRLRDHVVPPVLAGTGVEAHIGGVTASYSDLADRASHRLPLFILGVVGVSFLLLMAVFRSVLVPVKAALMNLLSIAAAYGVVVAVFQWGWGKSLVGLEQTVPIVSVIPMFMFSILFGLSMDYEVFLLSRVREEYVRTRDNTFSVIVGLAATARVITSAAGIMIFVFLGFVFGEDPLIKMMGLGLAVAVLVDATIVRMLLVPASMRLLGDRNWWMPGWLDRLLPDLDVEGVGDLPEPELRPDFVPVGDAEPDAEAPDRRGPRVGVAMAR